jgi:hypothetical protein
MKKEYVIILLIAAVAAIWYFFIHKPDASTLAANVIPAGGTSAAPVPAMAVQGPATPAANATATAPSQVLTAPDVVTPAAASVPSTTTAPAATPDSIILPWMNSLGVANKQQSLTMYPNMTDAEKAALADIIANVWSAAGTPGHRALTSADTAFWNAWRVKYHILDGTYNPFTVAESGQEAYNGFENESAQEAYTGHAIKPMKGGQQPYMGSNSMKGRKKY